MIQSKHGLVTVLTFLGLICQSISVAPAANSAMIACYQVKSPTGWTNIRDFKTRKIVGKLQNGMSFMSLGHMSDEISDDKSTYIDIYGVGKGRLMVEKKAARYISTGDNKTCLTVYKIIKSRADYINLRSTPNGSIIGRVKNQNTILYLGKSKDSEWIRVITIQGEIGWISSFHLEEISD